MLINQNALHVGSVLCVYPGTMNFSHLSSGLSFSYSFESGNWSIQSPWGHTFCAVWRQNRQCELSCPLPHCHYQPWGILWAWWGGIPEEHHCKAVPGRTWGIVVTFWKHDVSFLWIEFLQEVTCCVGELEEKYLTDKCMNYIFLLLHFKFLYMYTETHPGWGNPQSAMSYSRCCYERALTPNSNAQFFVCVWDSKYW